MQLSKKTIELLEDIERRIDPDAEEDFSRQWEDFLYDRTNDAIFTPVRKITSPTYVNATPTAIRFSRFSGSFRYRN